MTNFSGNAQTQHFVSWLSARIEGSAQLNFKHAEGHFVTLEAAHTAYRWPPRKKVISTPEGEMVLAAGSDLLENQVVLDRLSMGLRACLADPACKDTLLADWVKAILVWGGVYTRHKAGGGNAGWLVARLQVKDLIGNLTTAIAALKSGTIRFDHGPAGLRSNAGLTKVYSLAIDDFVIYDSRVAAALAWLVMVWAREEAGGVPDHLKFACMRANEGNQKGNPSELKKKRSPDTVHFPYFAPSTQVRDHWRHAVWNQRANHVLAAALGQAQARASQHGRDASCFQTVRDVEAALFVIGADLRHALGN